MSPDSYKVEGTVISPQVSQVRSGMFIHPFIAAKYSRLDVALNNRRRRHSGISVQSAVQSEVPPAYLIRCKL
jgi:hypothetical protein